MQIGHKTLNCIRVSTIHHKQKSNNRGEFKGAKPPKILNVYLSSLFNKNRYTSIILK